MLFFRTFFRHYSTFFDIFFTFSFYLNIPIMIAFFTVFESLTKCSFLLDEFYYFLFSFSFYNTHFSFIFKRVPNHSLYYQWSIRILYLTSFRCFPHNQSIITILQFTISFWPVHILFNFILSFLSLFHFLKPLIQIRIHNPYMVVNKM